MFLCTLPGLRASSAVSCHEEAEGRAIYKKPAGFTKLMKDTATSLSFLKDFPSCKLPPGFVQRWGKDFFLLNASLAARLQDVRERPAAAGLFLGRQETRGFVPSANLLPLLAGHDSWIELDEKTAWLFVCGRDVFAKSLGKQSASLGRFVIVKNSRGEVLGLATFNKAKKLFVNYMDIGYFLRRERSRRC